VTSQAVTAVIAARDALFDLFERIENVFRRLEVYIGVPPTVGMTDAIVKLFCEIFYSRIDNARLNFRLDTPGSASG